MFDTKNFAEQLQILREKARLTQAELAKKNQSFNHDD